MSLQERWWRIKVNYWEVESGVGVEDYGTILIVPLSLCIKERGLNARIKALVNLLSVVGKAMQWY